jgi:hypothetical protein
MGDILFPKKPIAGALKGPVGSCAGTAILPRLAVTFTEDQMHWLNETAAELDVPVAAVVRASVKTMMRAKDPGKATIALRVRSNG